LEISKIGCNFGCKFQRLHPNINNMNIKRNIIFALEGRKKDGVLRTEDVPIRMRVVYDGRRIEFTMRYRTDMAKWDSAKQRVKNGCINKLKISSSEINAELNKCESLIQDIFKEFELQDVLPTKEQIKQAYTAKIKSEEAKKVEVLPQKTFWDIYDEFTQENGKLNDWTKATFEKFAAQKNHIMEFKKNATFDMFTEKGLNDYVDFLGKKLGMRNSTIDKQLGFLKWFLRWSNKKGYHQNTAYDTFRPRLKNPDKPIIFLTHSEQDKLRDYKIPEGKSYLERVRDVFFFCCFTGLRYSDVYNLRRSDIKDDHIEITTVKTVDRLRIELNKHSKAILDKYKDVPFKNDKALPVISNQKMNDYLKDLCELAGIDTPVHLTYYRGMERIDEVHPKYELIGSHAGRRTFICNAIMLGIPANVIMKWTGHSDYKAMKPYIDVADETKASAMSKFNLL